MVSVRKKWAEKRNGLEGNFGAGKDDEGNDDDDDNDLDNFGGKLKEKKLE